MRLSHTLEENLSELGLNYQPESIPKSWEFDDIPTRCFLYNWNRGAWKIGSVDIDTIKHALVVPYGYMKIVVVDPQYIADWQLD